MSSSPSLLDHANGLLRNVLRLLVPLSAILTIYLYLYPFFLTCGFPLPAAGARASSQPGHLRAWYETARLHSPFAKEQPPAESTSGVDVNVEVNATVETAPRPSPLRVAPFRLLALGDPQLEGDTSIPNAYLDSSFPHLNSFFSRLTSRSEAYPTFRKSTKQAFHDLVDFYFDDIPNTLESIRKRIDHFGNDFYLAHIYRTVRWWTVPTHVTVLGDLLGSQWISDEEFERRGARFWNRAFAGSERVPNEVAAWPAPTYDVAGTLGTAVYNHTWQSRILNVAGNHDIGYAGDLTTERFERFERVFGKANYEVRFELPPEVLTEAGAASIRNATAEVSNDDDGAADEINDRLIPELRVIVLNDMNLDTPVVNVELQDQTYSFVNDVINTATAVEFQGHFTVVLTHVPLYKPEGICVDAPFFSFHELDGTLKEQNQLSKDASKGFVEGIFGLSGDATAPGGGLGRRGVILNGHDHEGCDTYHFINQSDAAEDRAWQTRTWRNVTAEGLMGQPSLPGMREITVRSMMGGYGGNAGLLSAWFDEDSWQWRFEYAECPLGTQHLWWAVHIMDLIAVALGCVYAVTSIIPQEKKSVDKTKANGSHEKHVQTEEICPS